MMMEALTKALAAYDVTPWSDHRGQAHADFRNGNRLVMAHDNGNTLRMVAYIDYGEHGRNYVAGNTYKTAAGAARFAKGYLR